MKWKKQIFFTSLVVLLIPTLTVTLVKGNFFDPGGGGGGGQTPESATVSGYVKALEHENANIQYAKVVLKTGTLTLGYDWTDSNGYYSITTDPFLSDLSCQLTVTYKHTGRYITCDWIEPATKYFTISKGESYSKNFYVYDHAEYNLDVTFHVDTVDYLSYFVLQLDWNIDPNPVTGDPEVTLNSWICDIAGIPTHFDGHFAFQGYHTYPLSAANKIDGSDTYRYFYTIGGEWVTHSGTAGFSSDVYMYLWDTSDYDSWGPVTYNSIEGDYGYGNDEYLILVSY
jgi:hypothetical protein